jgi:hypothetical protein
LQKTEVRKNNSKIVKKLLAEHTLVKNQRSRLFDKEIISGSMNKRAVEQTGLIPRSIIRTFERFRKQLLPGAEMLVIQEFRISRYQVIVSVKCLMTLFFLKSNLPTRWFNKTEYPLVSTIVGTPRILGSPAISVIAMITSLSLSKNSLYFLA